MKTYFFLSGLPRSGSTLLSSILNQNPDIYCSPEQSLICDLIYNVELYINNSQEYNSWTNESGKNNICKSLIDNFYSHRKETYIIDKSRSWGTPYNLNLIQRYITSDIKIICPVRPIIEILASFIKIFNQDENQINFVDKNIEFNNRFCYRPLDDVRCDELMIPGGPIDKALFSLSQSKVGEHKNKFHIVEYEDLVSNPKSTIEKIYDFLNIDYFNHNFDHIESSSELNHGFYGISNLHKIRPKISKNSPNPEEILSDYVLNKYSNYEIWR